MRPFNKYYLILSSRRSCFKIHITTMNCYIHCIVEQVGTKSDCWQFGKVRLTRTQAVKEGPGVQQLKNVKVSPVIDIKA